jgi:hypothetical protein
MLLPAKKHSQLSSCLKMVSFTEIILLKLLTLKTEYLTFMAAKCLTLAVEVVNVNIIQLSKGNNIVLISNYS